MVRALAKEGTVEVLGEHLLVRGAKEVTLYLTATTTFNLYGVVMFSVQGKEKVIKINSLCKNTKDRHNNIVHQ
jgi:hypothetical protein